MDSILKEISQMASELKASGDMDLDTCKIGVLFPLIEYLGYDTTTVGDVQTAPIYTPDGSYKVDYGLRDESPDTFKTVVKVIPEGVTVTDDELSKLRSCLLQVPSIKYVIITDCFNYSVYYYDGNSNTLGDIASFNICDEDSIPEDVLEILQNPASETEKQEFAEYEDEEYEGPKNLQIFEDLDDDDEEPEPPPPPPKKGVKWWMVIAAQLVIVGIIALLVFMFRNPDNQVMHFFGFGNQNELDYYDIAASMETNLNKATQELEIQFYSKDIPEGGVIRFDIVNGEDSAVLYGAVASNGRLNGKYTIPSYWKNPKITVTAYLKFDEIDHQQPQAVRSKFGELGEKIVGKDGAPSRFALTFSTIDYDSQAVQDYLLWLKEQEEANLRAERINDFSSFEVRYDSLGNIKVLPSGYDMNQNNITGNVHIYPQIFYDAGSNFAHVYLVCGQISSVTWSMFRSVSFYADGTAWSYDIGNNDKRQQVTGQYITEWVYFDNYNIASLPSEAALLGTADVAQVSFNGAKAATFTLSDEEKGNIAAALALFNKYFSDKNNPPSTSWFENTEIGGQGSSGNQSGGNQQVNENDYSLAYIYTPDRILERDATDQKSLKKLEDAIAEANQNGGATPTQLATYEIDSHKYRVMSDSLKTALMNDFKDAHSMLVYDQDYASMDDYYVLFFEYSNPKSIEAGYIPYVYVAPNKTVYLPVKTSTGATISEKSYASFILSQNTYDMLVQEVANTEYEQIVEEEE